VLREELCHGLGNHLQPFQVEQVINGWHANCLQLREQSAQQLLDLGGLSAGYAADA
jgi:hypothetical protein